MPALQIISLGSHSIDADFEQAVLLMEVMPSLLAKRNFDPLNTLLQLEPGYRDSPEPDENMAIVFVKVSPAACQGTGGRHACDLHVMLAKMLSFELMSARLCITVRVCLAVVMFDYHDP